MRSLERTIGIGETRYDGDAKITVESAKPKKKSFVPGEVAEHEAKHVVAARANGTGVESATVIRGKDYLGLTKLDRPDPVAAAAPHATGSDGTGHDIFIIGLMGHDVNSASNAARGIIFTKKKEVEVVASLLEEKGTVTGFEIEDAIEQANEKTEKVIVTVEDSDNDEYRKEEVLAKEGIVIFRRDSRKKEEFDLAA